ncbi:MAG: DUF1801 domain-containing protein [Phototrophicaceae bacterium]
MSSLKIQANDGDVLAYLNTIEHERKREDAFTVLRMMEEITGEKATMWGDSIVGFGMYQYTYESGRTGEWFLTGFAPRKQNLTLYIISGFDEFDALREQLGKHKVGSSCLYINKLADVDMDTLRDLVTQSVAHMKKTNP